MTALPIEGYAREYTDPAKLIADIKARKARLWVVPPRPVEVVAPVPVRAVVSKTAFGNLWTPEEVERLKALVADGATIGGLSRALKRTAEAVKTKANKLGLKVQRKSPLASQPVAAVAHYRLVVETFPIGAGSKAVARHIVRSVAEQSGLTEDDIFGKARTQPLSRVRRQAIWLVAKELPNWSKPCLGQFFGLDHTSILYAIRAENDQRGENLRGAGGVPPQRRAAKLKAAVKSKGRANG